MKYVENTSTVLIIDDLSVLQLKFILPWTNHIYIEYELLVRWPSQAVTKSEFTVVEVKPEIKIPTASTTQKAPEPPEPECGLNLHYTISVKGKNYSLA